MPLLNSIQFVDNLANEANNIAFFGKCHHTFHLTCINTFFTHPPTDPERGYCCPTCRKCCAKDDLNVMQRFINFPPMPPQTPPPQIDMEDGKFIY